MWWLVSGLRSHLRSRFALLSNTRGWQAAAVQAGLEDIEVSTLRGRTIAVSGRAGPLGFAVQPAGGRETGPRIVVSGLARISARADGPGSGPRTGPGSQRDVETGDPFFDRDVRVSGQRLMAHALLDEPTRDGLRRILNGTVEDAFTGSRLQALAELESGELRVTVPDEFGRDLGAHLAGILRSVIDLALRLVEPPDVPERLARNARTDRVPGVRRANLLALCSSNARPDLVRATLEAACGDESEEVRLEAAIGLGEGGVEVLRALAASAAEAAVAVRAASALGSVLPPAEAEAILVGRGLADTDEAVRLAAAAALEVLGTVTAVPALREMEARGTGAERGAARQAVAGIQSRLNGAAPGQVSLSGAEAGHLSVAEEQGGEVSLSGEAEGD